MYEPQEDSFLLAEQVNLYAKGKVLDMGTGSGIQARVAAQKIKVDSVLAVDIDQQTILFNKKKDSNKKITWKKSNLFDKIPKQKFDTIIFNPPYLPADQGTNDQALIGGKKGWEIIAVFLSKATDYLAQGGQILIIFSSLSQKKKIDSILNELLLEYQEVAHQHIFFEDLFVYYITKTFLLEELHKKGVNSIAYYAKGKRGIVYKGLFEKKCVAIKIINPLSHSQEILQKEAQWLSKVNKIGIGPKLIFLTQNSLVMEFVKGKNIQKWLTGASRGSILTVLKNVMKQCNSLDMKGINKEEMHRPHKHIIISKKPMLIDFERAHTSERPKNVTQFCQYITNITSELAAKNIYISSTALRNTAKEYVQNNKKFKQILALIIKATNY